MGTNVNSTAAGSLGSSGLGALVTFFGDRALAVKRNRGGLLSVVNRNYENQVATVGTAVNVPIITAASTTLLTDGSSVSRDDTIGTFKALTLNKYRTYTFSFSQVAQAIAGNSPVSMEIDQRIADMLNDIEYDVASLATAAITTNTVGSYNSAFTEANAVSAISKLDVTKTGMPRHGFLSPTANGWASAIKISNFVNSQYIGGATPLSNDPSMYGTHYWNGVYWHMTQAVNIAGGTDCDGFIVGPDAILFASRPLAAPMSSNVTMLNINADGIAMQLSVSWDKDYLADQMTLSVLYGFSIGEEKYGCQFKH
jgi:hypothetical protein